MSVNLAAQLTRPIAYQHYRDLPAGMFAESNPTASHAPTLIELNQALVEQLGVDAAWFRSDRGLAVLSGNAVDKENQPIVMAYAGHQFGHWVPLLGDGRAHMLGQMIAADGTVVDVQLKGSGRTQFSRGGDGRATLGSVLGGLQSKPPNVMNPGNSDSHQSVCLFTWSLSGTVERRLSLA